MEGNNLEFRLLSAEEIDCRISTVKKNGLSLLLYKDARVDQNILDETVGCMNWARSHQLIGDRLYCTVSIRDPETREWISKQDVGTESYTEKEKGQASDSFKRACFNWGIGRELYTAPFIWIPADDCRINVKNDGKCTCYDVFRVEHIAYDARRNITGLDIVNNRGKIVYQFGELMSGDKRYQGDDKTENVNTAHINALYLELSRTGVGLNGILKTYGLQDIHDITIEQFKAAMDILKKKPDKVPKSNTIPPDYVDEKLPWN